MGFSCICCMCISTIILYKSVNLQSICMFKYCIQFKIFTWHSPTGGWGCYNMVSELQFSTLSLDGPSKLKLK
jgi:hypothetical protein